MFDASALYSLSVISLYWFDLNVWFFIFSAFLCGANLCTSCWLKLSFMMNKNGNPTDLFMVLMAHAPNADMFSYTIRWSSAFNCSSVWQFLRMQIRFEKQRQQKKSLSLLRPWPCTTQDTGLITIGFIASGQGKRDSLRVQKAICCSLLLHDCTFRSNWILGISRSLWTEF